MRKRRLCADENIPALVVEALEKQKWDVWSIRRDARGLDDKRILELCLAEERTILTFDKDFGELVFHQGNSGVCGIILLRMPLMLPEDLCNFIVNVLAQRDDWAEHFSVIEREKIRMRALPAAGSGGFRIAGMTA